MCEELSDEEKEEYCNSFYNAWEWDVNDIESGNPYPWGCPWNYDSTKDWMPQNNESIKEAAIRYYQNNRSDILNEIKNELFVIYDNDLEWNGFDDEVNEKRAELLDKLIRINQLINE